MSSPAPARQFDDPQLDSALRPKLLSEFAGQTKVTDNLKVAIEAAKSRGEAMDHVMLYGSAGLGKSTICAILGHELGVPTMTCTGPNMRKGMGLGNLLRSLKPSQILFIDEIHAMDRTIEEMLYPAMEDFRLDYTLGGGNRLHSRSIQLEHFTVVGATTKPGKLTAALRDKFKILLQLELYGVGDLKLIVARSGRLLGMHLEDSAVEDIANCSRGVPRIANNLIRRVRDYAQVHHGGFTTITHDIARAALELYGIDSHGLNHMDRAIITALVERFDGKAVGLDTLAAAVDADKATIDQQHEPHLLRLGFVDRTPRGRMATEKAFSYLEGRNL